MGKCPFKQNKQVENLELLVMIGKLRKEKIALKPYFLLGTYIINKRPNIHLCYYYEWSLIIPRARASAMDPN